MPPDNIPRPTNLNGVVSTYSNNVEIVQTPVDVRLYFNEIILGGDRMIANESRAHIVMSPEHFRLMLQSLGVPQQDGAADGVTPEVLGQS